MLRGEKCLIYDDSLWFIEHLHLIPRINST